jgi:hypothetical protein
MDSVRPGLSTVLMVLQHRALNVQGAPKAFCDLYFVSDLRLKILRGTIIRSAHGPRNRRSRPGFDGVRVELAGPRAAVRSLSNIIKSAKDFYIQTKFPKKTVDLDG